jgi:Cutinase
MMGMAGLALWVDHNLKKFSNSIAGGISDLITTLKDFHNTCPPTVYVLGGYSQGAMVVHQAENKLSASLRSLIAGTLLLGDGNRVIRTKAKAFGTSPASRQGVETYLRDDHFPSMPPVKDVPLPKTTADICNKNDIVCDFNKDSLPNFSADAKVHTSYAKCNKQNKCVYEKVLGQAATWVGNLVIRRLIG